MSTAPDIPTPNLPATSPGTVVIARHGEPALSRRIKLSSSGYRRWWAAYEEGGIVDPHKAPAGLLELVRQADVIFASVRRRAVETAEAVVQGKHFVRDPMFVEAPLPPPGLPEFIRLSPKTWGVIARASWWFGRREGQESRSEAEARARAAAARLAAEAAEGKNVVLLAHGYFNHMVGREMKRLGWRLASGRGYKYWSTRKYVRE
jgi:broad specificity phosphatase PhoE